MSAEHSILQRIQEYRDVPGGLLPLLHAIQGDLGYIPADAVASIASGMGLSRAEVHGVISFYHDFRTEPGGRHVVQICRAEACQAMGARALEAHAKTILGMDLRRYHRRWRYQPAGGVLPGQLRLFSLRAYRRRHSRPG